MHKMPVARFVLNFFSYAELFYYFHMHRKRKSMIKHFMHGITLNQPTKTQVEILSNNKRLVPASIVIFLQLIILLGT